MAPAAADRQRRPPEVQWRPVVEQEHNVTSAKWPEDDIAHLLRCCRVRTSSLHLQQLLSV